MLQTITHYSLHILFPAVIAWVFYRDQWKRAYLILLATMLIDLDHLFASPIFDPNRCSVGFHLLHNYVAIAIYLVMLFFKQFRIVAIGLLLHIATDLIDCFWMK